MRTTKAKGTTAAPCGVLFQLALGALAPSPNNPRVFPADDPTLDALAASIREQGVMQPVVVRELEHGRFELVCGERRFRASKIAGLKTIPAVARKLSDIEALALTITENLQRETLHPTEEAIAIEKLLALHDRNIERVAQVLGKLPSWVARRARLIGLSEAWRTELRSPHSFAGGWSAPHIELVARITPEAQDRVLHDLQTRMKFHQTYLRVDELEKMLADYTRDIRSAPWKANDATLDVNAGPCDKCPLRSSVNRGLFDEVDSKGKPVDRCLHAPCWSRKLDAFVLRRAEQLRLAHKNLLLLQRDHAPIPASLEKANIVQQYSVQVVKKFEKGATPALIVAGTGAGSLIYVREFSHFDDPAQKAKNGDGTLTDKEKARRLERRRTAKAVATIADKILKSDAPQEDIAVGLVGAFGTAHKWDDGGQDYDFAAHAITSGTIRETKHVKRRDVLLTALKESSPSIANRLWSLVQPVLEHRFKYVGSFTNVDEQLADAKVIADVMGLDADALESAARASIRTPKSQEETATPKPKAKAKKPSKKAG